MCPEKTKHSRRPTRTDVVLEARTWVGTKYQHQAMVKGSGCDCVGLISAVGRDTGAFNITDEDIKAYSGYGRLPNPRKMGEVIKKHLVPIDESEADVGDIVWIEWKQGLPMHLALIGEHNGKKTLIHAYSRARKVTEHRFGDEWRAMVSSYWRYPWLQ